MIHKKTNDSIFDVYMAPNAATLIKEQTSDTDTEYVTISAIQTALRAALNDMLAPLQQLIRSAATSGALRQIVAIRNELENGDASLVLPYIDLVLQRPTLAQARDMVLEHPSMSLPDNILKWLNVAPKDGHLVIRDDAANERTAVSVSVEAIDV